MASELVLTASPPAAVAALQPVKPGPAGTFYGLPAAPLRVFTTSSGLRLYVPVSGDQAWDAPLPSTPYPDRSLRLRCQHTLRCGFTKA